MTIKKYEKIICKFLWKNMSSLEFRFLKIDKMKNYLSGETKQ